MLVKYAGQICRGSEPAAGGCVPKVHVMYWSNYGQILLNPGRRLLVKSGVRGSCGAEASPARSGCRPKPFAGQTAASSPCTGQTMAARIESVHWSNAGCVHQTRALVKYTGGGNGRPWTCLLSVCLSVSLSLSLWLIMVKK